MQNLLAAKRAIVSGVGPGTGFEIAKALSAHGAHVVVSNRSGTEVDSLIDEIGRTGGTVHYQRCDVTDPEDCQALARFTVDKLGGIDILVNNAFAGGRAGSIETIDIAKGWAPAFKVNVYGTMQMCQAVIGHMREAGGGSIVMINSMAHRLIPEGMTAYAASKAALMVATQGLAQELGKDKIRVNSVVPSHIDTPNLAIYFDILSQQNASTPDQERANIAALGSLNHITTPQEVADAAVFLCSPLANSITGVRLDVNAGQAYF